MIQVLIYSLIAIFIIPTPDNVYASTKNTLENTPTIFYVDSKNGDNGNSGGIDSPFLSLDKALSIVSQRVNGGTYSDKIYLREGTYKRPLKTRLLYQLNIKGTKNNLSLISAMPATANHPNATQRKSGLWYENVVIDDGFAINTPWRRITKNSKIWSTKPGFIKDEWNNTLVRREKSIELTDNDKTPRTTLFTLAPYMILQDNNPLVWASSIEEIDKQGMRTYDQETDTLYVRPLNDINPNNAVIESWYGGQDQRFRSIFGGKIEYTKITGIKFRLFTRFFSKPAAFNSERERMLQKHVHINDNYFSHGWLHIFTDVGGNKFQGLFTPKWGKLAPHFDDSSNWTVKNNIFYHPSREIFQAHGPNHIFELNDIIEHGGPWSGPMTFASAVNTRNTNNAVIRNNFVLNEKNQKPIAGSIFMIELTASHANKNNECQYGGQTIENNIFANLSQGTSIYLGRGGCIMKNITIRNNIFKTNKGRGTAILITTPHKNLIINNNVFYDQKSAIKTYDEKRNNKSFGTAPFDSNPSTISIDSNIFSNNIKTIDHRLINNSRKGNTTITNNLFYKNNNTPKLASSIYENPLFVNPEGLNFQVKNNSICIQENSHDIGAYDSKRAIDESLKWWKHSH